MLCVELLVCCFIVWCGGLAIELQVYYVVFWVMSLAVMVVCRSFGMIAG